LFYATKIKGVNNKKSAATSTKCLLQVSQTSGFVLVASWCIVGLLAGAIVEYFFFSNQDEKTTVSELVN
jgi:hypothetical protein